MALQDYYRQIMDISMMEDNAKKAEASKAVFESLNKAKMPDQFNWAEEIFEGIHVKERPGQAALLWLNIDTNEERRFT
ncbi:MAG: acetyl-CoA synthetase, partial [Desulfobaccales bacterium]